MASFSERPAVAAPWVLASLALIFGACDCGGTEPGVGAPCDVETPCSGELVCEAGRCVAVGDDGGPIAGGGAGSDGGPVAGGGGSSDVDGGPVRTITGVRILPDPATLDAIAGESSTIDLDAVIVYSDGSETPLSSGLTFFSDNPSVGTIDSSTGVFTANGGVGGTVEIRLEVRVGGEIRTDLLSLSVALSQTIGGGDAADHFDGTPIADASRQAGVVYPLDGVIMPQNVMPADIQWTCGGSPCAEGDAFRITLSKPGFEVVAYVDNEAEAMNDHWLVALDAWRTLAQTSPSMDATLTVDRFVAADDVIVSGTPQTMTFAPTAITGTVYYWDIDDEKIRRIDDGSATSSIAIPFPDSPLGDVDGDDCVGCHAVSNSGRYMLGNTHFSNYGAVYDLTRDDLGDDPAPTEWPSSESIRWRTATWSPDDTRAMVSGAGGNDDLRLIDPFTGGTLPVTMTTGGAWPRPNATMPAWPLDDSAVAFIDGINSWAGNITTGDLALLAITGDDSFGDVTEIHDATTLSGALEGGNVDSYPTWTPDSAFIAFAHGTSSRSDPRNPDGGWAVGDFAATSAIYLIRPDGTGLVRLEALGDPTEPERRDGASGSTERRGLDFQPNFSPFSGGGYYWLSFLSRRPYGNSIAGNSDEAIGLGQIWVAAIRVDADGTIDPSARPYWLPGQDPRHRSVSAFWAPRACRETGEDCSVGSECCGGTCQVPDGGSESVCVPPPADQCRQLGQTCDTDSDCCDAMSNPDVSCTNNVCVEFVVPG